MFAAALPMLGKALPHILPAAASLFGGMFGKKDDAGGSGGMGYTAPQWLQNPQYDFTEPRLQQTSDFISQQINALQRGEMPDWYTSAMPQLREGMMRGARQWLHGGPMTGMGAMDQGRAAGAAMGVGPRAGMANTNKALSKYGDMTSAIDEYLTGKGVDISERASMAFPQMSSTLPQGPQGQWLAPQPYQQQGGGMMDSLGGLMKNLPWGSIASGIGSLFGPKSGGGSGWSGLLGGSSSPASTQSYAPGNTWSGLGVTTPTSTQTFTPGKTGFGDIHTTKPGGSWLDRR